MQLFTHLLSSYLQGMGDFFSALPREGWGGPPGGMVGVCGQDYHFAIFRYEKYKKHSFCVGFHHFFYNFALGKRDSASPCGYFSRLGAQFYSYGSYINKPTK